MALRTMVFLIFMVGSDASLATVLGSRRSASAPASGLVEDLDFVSLVSVSTELKRSVPAHSIVSHQVSTSLPIERADLEGLDWEQRFADGESLSKQFADNAVDEKQYSWVSDAKGVSGAVPVEMKQAEDLLVAAEEAPEGAWKEKTSVWALRLYHHAKWLAERGHASAAEFRFREATALAKRSRRSVLASHALGRLGYFLLQWRRPVEAKEALAEAERLNGRTNPLATYLHAVLQRQHAGADVEALYAAEDRILSVGAQPSEELEMERKQHVEDIKFWRSAAEGSIRDCFTVHNVVNVLICVLAHSGLALRPLLMSAVSGSGP